MTTPPGQKNLRCSKAELAEIRATVRRAHGVLRDCPFCGFPAYRSYNGDEPYFFCAGLARCGLRNVRFTKRQWNRRPKP